MNFLKKLNKMIENQVYDKSNINLTFVSTYFISIKV